MFIFFLIIAAFIAILLIAVWFRNNKRRKRIIGNLPIVLPRDFPFTIDRPNTPYIQSVVPVPDSAVDALRDGIQQMLLTTPAYWNIARNIGDYNVAFIDPTATNQDGSPALIVRGIQSAGTVIGVANDGHVPPVIVLPHQGATNWTHLDYLENSARHESEHIAEWVNDIEAFYRFLGAGDIHPHYP